MKKPEITTLDSMIQNEESDQLIETEKAAKTVQKARKPKASEEKPKFKKTYPHGSVEILYNLFPRLILNLETRSYKPISKYFVYHKWRISTEPSSL
jgi:hypothetical protein